MFSKNHRKCSISMYSMTILFNLFLYYFLINTFAFFIPHFVYFILVFSVDFCPLSLNFTCVQNLLVFICIQNNLFYPCLCSFLSICLYYPKSIFLVILVCLLQSCRVSFVILISYMFICSLILVRTIFFCLIYSLLCSSLFVTSLQFLFSLLFFFSF